MKKTSLLALIAICILSVSFTNEEQKPDPKLKKIFNGKNLNGWTVEPADQENIWWTANDGILSVKSGPKKTGSILWTKNSYKDFVIQMDFKFGKGRVDSGIFLRTEKQQIQIGESGSLKRDMTCSPYIPADIPGTGYPAEAKNIDKLFKQGEWNTIKVRAIGSIYTMWLNGEEVLTYESPTAIEEGPVGLQLHGNRDMNIDFRNVEFAVL